MKQTLMKQPLAKRRSTSAKTSSQTNVTRTAFAIAFAVLLWSGVAPASGDEADHGNAMMDTIWQGVNLAIVLGVIFYFGRKPVSDYFASRRGGIQTELDEAAKLLAMAEQRNSELQRRLVDLSSEVDGIQEAANRRAEEESERILAEARATAERIRSDAKAAVSQELHRAKLALREEAANLAMDIAVRKLDEQVGDADRERLMDEFITRIEPTAAEGANR